MAKVFDLRVDVLGPDAIKERYPLITVDDVVGGIFIPSDGQTNPIDVSRALAKGARDGGVLIREGVSVTAIAPRRRAGHGRRDAGRRHCGGDGGALGRHVDPRACGHHRRPRAAPRLRALLRDDRPVRGRDAGPARAARLRRLRLLQGGRGQDPARRLRARRQALGHGRHPRGLLLRPAARRLRAFRAGADAGAEAHAGAGGRGHPDLLLRARELHARRPLPPRRGAGARRLLHRRRVQLHRHPVGRRRGEGAGRVHQDRQAVGRYVGRGHTPQRCRSRPTGATCGSG